MKKIFNFNEHRKEQALDFLFNTEQGGEIQLKDCIDKDIEYRIIIQDICKPVNWKKLKEGIKPNIIYNVKLCSGFEDMCVDMSRNHKFVFPYKTFSEAYIKAKKDVILSEKDVYDVIFIFKVKPFRIKRMEFIKVN